MSGGIPSPTLVRSHHLSSVGFLSCVNTWNLTVRSHHLSSVGFLSCVNTGNLSVRSHHWSSVGFLSCVNTWKGPFFGDTHLVFA
ncbi:hypothetical protein SDJN03_06867, partial [Cucurbita argyrosperma subsp. sororia]